MAAPYKYEIRFSGLMQWVASKLEHVGRIVATKNRHLQKSYAMSTVNSMAHLKDALYEAIQDASNEQFKENLLRAHDSVIRTMKHLIRDFGVSVRAIREFNTEHVLSDLSYLRKTYRKHSSRRRSSSRKN